MLILTLSKLIEATSLKTIDSMIDEVKTSIKEETQQVTKVPVPNETNQTIVEEKTIEPKPVIEESLYEKVIAKVYDRSEDLGNCFENSFKYNSYENNILKTTALQKSSP